MTRDAEMPARDYVALVRSGLAPETDIGVLQSLIRQAVSALYLFTADCGARGRTGRIRRRPSGAVCGCPSWQRPPARPHRLS